ncbi:hypothetical protein GCM10022224_005180 [Nonomuraea antimicrobica]|uniref:Uncharacterized protein n=1 Tax=Nonomuraea antimicrobica TaxID=561173 RepID=A0ABP7B207_9ACTN
MVSQTGPCRTMLPSFSIATHLYSMDRSAGAADAGTFGSTTKPKLATDPTDAAINALRHRLTETPITHEQNEGRS